MLVRITDYCTMGCAHCMINASKQGKHMDKKTFRDTLKFIKPIDLILFLSGGEPTQHPEFLEFLEIVNDHGFDPEAVLIMSNGTFLEDKTYTDKILDFGYRIQVTNDSRFYPKTIIKIDHPLITYVDRINQVSPFGRALKNRIPVTQKYPECFNLRSIAYCKTTFSDVIDVLRILAKKYCTPAINTDGSISAGETPFCGRIGTIYSTDEELMKGIRSLSCNNCGLDKNLTGKYAEQWEKINNDN